MKDETYHVEVGEHTYKLTFEGDRLLLDGEPVLYAFERLDAYCFALQLDGRSAGVVLEPVEGGRVRVTVQNRCVTVRVKDARDLLLERFGLDEDAAAAEREVRAPMPGLVLEVMVEAGQAVEAGEGLLVLEAMKMENELMAPSAGIVAAVYTEAGQPVDKDALLVEFEM